MYVLGGRRWILFYTIPTYRMLRFVAFLPVKLTISPRCLWRTEGQLSLQGIPRVVLHILSYELLWTYEVDIRWLPLALCLQGSIFFEFSKCFCSKTETLHLHRHFALDWLAFVWLPCYPGTAALPWKGLTLFRLFLEVATVLVQETDLAEVCKVCRVCLGWAECGSFTGLLCRAVRWHGRPKQLTKKWNLSLLASLNTVRATCMKMRSCLCTICTDVCVGWAEMNSVLHNPNV